MLGEVVRLVPGEFRVGDDQAANDLVGLVEHLDRVAEGDDLLALLLKEAPVEAADMPEERARFLVHAVRLAQAPIRVVTGCLDLSRERVYPRPP